LPNTPLANTLLDRLGLKPRPGLLLFGGAESSPANMYWAGPSGPARLLAQVNNWAEPLHSDDFSSGRSTSFSSFLFSNPLPSVFLFLLACLFCLNPETETKTKLGFALFYAFHSFALFLPPPLFFVNCWVFIWTNPPLPQPNVSLPDKHG